MRYLVISDIHANLEALRAVLDSARGEHDRVVSCGDLVGYGADPVAVLDWTRENVSQVVRGNHDKACAGSEDIEWFSPAARSAALWTIAVLSPEHAAYLRNLPKGPVQADGFQILHGAPLDEDEYLVNPVSAFEQAPVLESAVAFFGHTHVQGGFRCHPNGVLRIPPVRAEEREWVLNLRDDETSLINPGSVGQPRDGDWRAAYCLYSPEERTVTYRRAAYDLLSAQRKIYAAGLPHILAERLSVGR